MFTKVKDKAAHKKAMAAARGVCGVSPARSLMEFLDGRYPRVPAEYLVSYQVNFAPRPPPPLDILCPDVNFKQEAWDSLESEMVSWMKQVRDREQYFEAGFESAMDAQLVVLVGQLVDWKIESDYSYRSFGLACPDVYLCRRPSSPMLICLMDMDNLLQSEDISESPQNHHGSGARQADSVENGGPKFGQHDGLTSSEASVENGSISEAFKSAAAENGSWDFTKHGENDKRPRQGESSCDAQFPQLVLTRLYHYMQMTGTYFGAVSCLKKTWICKRVIADDGSKEVMQLSRPLDRPVVALAFIIDQARCLVDLSPQPPLQSCRPLELVQDGFNSGPIMEQLKFACKAAQARHTDKILG